MPKKSRKGMQATQFVNKSPKRGLLGGLTVSGRSPIGCNHALAKHEEVVDTNGRLKVVSYALHCTARVHQNIRVKGTKGRKNKIIPVHVDSTGRTWT